MSHPSRALQRLVSLLAFYDLRFYFWWVFAVSYSIRKERTIAKPAVLRGFGYWSGQDVNVEFRPAAPGTGHVFVRRDLIPHRRIQVSVDSRTDVPRRTNLSDGTVEVQMVEHLLAALAGLCIDNCEIWVDAAEMPGNDGSCQDAVNALLESGIVEQDSGRPCIRIDRVIRVGTADQWIEARPADRLVLKYDLDFGRRSPIERHELEWVAGVDSFANKIAPARTFIQESSAELLRSQGLALRTSHKDLLVFGENGLIDNELRFKDECVRHKILDLVGDLALAGCDFQGYILAHRSGHRLNALLVRALQAGHALAFEQRDSA